MGQNKKPSASSRRGFFSLLLANKENSNTNTVKMLTADGKLVEIDKAVLEQASLNKKSSNKEIYEWMKNPSKESDKH
jgi:hypothetical protein